MLARQGFYLLVAASMLLCAVVFFPWFKPRETVCGLAGRWAEKETGWKGRIGVVFAGALNALVHRHDETCGEVYVLEEAARAALYKAAAADLSEK